MLTKGKLYRYVDPDFHRCLPLLNQPYNGQNDKFLKELGEVSPGTIVMFLEFMMVEFRASGSKGYTEEPWNLVIHGEIVGWMHGRLEDVETEGQTLSFGQ